MRQVGSHQALRDGRAWMATLRENFAANLDRLLSVNRMTQRAFADAVDVTEQTVSKWMNLRVFPEDKQIDRIAKALGVTYEDLVRDPDTKPAKALGPKDLDTVLRDFARLRGYDVVPKRTKPS